MKYKYKLTKVKAPARTRTTHEELQRKMEGLSKGEGIRAEMPAGEGNNFRAAVYQHNRRAGLKVQCRKVSSDASSGTIVLMLTVDDGEKKQGPKLGARRKKKGTKA